MDSGSLMTKWCVIFLLLPVLAHADFSVMNGVSVDSAWTFNGVSGAVEINGAGAVASAGWDDPYKPFAWYPMQNEAGSVPDASLSDNDATMSSMLYDYDELAYKGDALDRWITVDDNTILDGSGASTVVFWFQSSGSGSMYLCDSDTQILIAFDLVADKLSYYVNTGTWSASTDSATTLTNGLWYQVVATFDDPDFILYLNGVSNSAGVKAGNLNNNSGTFQFSNADQELDGLISGMRIYDRAFSAAEVTTLFGAGRTNDVIATVSTNNLLAYYDTRLDDGFRDLGSGGNSGYPLPSVFAGPTPTTDGANAMSGSPNENRVENSNDFDGSDDRFLVSTTTGFSAQTNGLSATAWVKRDSNDDNDTIMGNWDFGTPASISWKLVFDDVDAGRTGFVVYQDGNPAVYLATYGADVPSNKWVHIGATFDGSTNLVISTNGIALVTTNSTAGTWTNMSYDSSYEFLVGSAEIGANHFDGQIDDVKVYPDVLTQGEMLTLAEKTGLQGTPIPDNRDENGY